MNISSRLEIEKLFRERQINFGLIEVFLMKEERVWVEGNGRIDENYFHYTVK